MTATTAITAAEYAAAVRAAHAECDQEICAAAAEYAQAVRPLAYRCLARGKAARAKRDTRLAQLKAALGSAPRP